MTAEAGGAGGSGSDPAEEADGHDAAGRADDPPGSRGLLGDWNRAHRDGVGAVLLVGVTWTVLLAADVDRFVRLLLGAYALVLGVLLGVRERVPRARLVGFVVVAVFAAVWILVRPQDLETVLGLAVLAVLGPIARSMATLRGR